MTNTQRKFWPDIGPPCDDGEMCGRFLPTPQVMMPVQSPEKIKARMDRYRKEGKQTGGIRNLASEIIHGTLTSLPAASPANPYPLPEPDAVIPTPVGSGPKCIEFAQYSDQDSCWLKTSQGYAQRMVDGSSEEWLRTWPRSGLVSGGIAYRQPPSVPRISGTGCSLLPTPNSTDYKGVSQPKGRRPICDDDLPSRVAREMLPTPSSTDGSKAPKFHKGGNPSLPCAVEMEAGERDSTGAKVGGGQLAPGFVEWMMGFPRGWTDIGETENGPTNQESSEACPTESPDSSASETP